MSTLSTVLYSLFVLMLATVVNGFPQEPCPEGWDLPLPHSTKCYKIIKKYGKVYDFLANCRDLGEGANLAYGLPDIHTQRSIIDRFNRPPFDEKKAQYMIIYAKDSPWKNYGDNTEDAKLCDRVNMRTLRWESVACDLKEWHYGLCEIPRTEEGDEIDID